MLGSKGLAALLGQPRSPDYDSVVIAGNGIAALAFAARLARSPDYAGKVVVAAPPVTEARRLISGVSLRSRAADCIADAMGIETDVLLQAVCGSAALPVVCRERSSLARRDASGDWSFARSRQRRLRPDPEAGPGRPVIAYGLRNARIVAGMLDLIAGLGIRQIDEMPRSAVEMRAMAPGSRPLLVNASADARLLGAAPRQPGRMVLASQVPFLEKPVGPVYPLQSGTAYAPLMRRAGGIDFGHFMPYADPLSPQARWYGLVSRVVDADSAFDPYRELEAMTESLFGIGEALGLTPYAPSETLGCALVPAAPYWGSIRSAPGTLELRRAYFGGSPAFYMDGMLSPAAGGLLAARAVLAGADPDLVVRRALHTQRRQMFLRWVERTRLPLLGDRLAGLSGSFTRAFPQRAMLRGWAMEAKADRIVMP